MKGYSILSLLFFLFSGLNPMFIHAQSENEAVNDQIGEGIEEVLEIDEMENKEEKEASDDRDTSIEEEKEEPENSKKDEVKENNIEEKKTEKTEEIIQEVEESDTPIEQLTQPLKRASIPVAPFNSGHTIYSSWSNSRETIRVGATFNSAGSYALDFTSIRLTNVNGVLLWCVEPGAPLSFPTGSGYTRSNVSNDRALEASLIAYWGYEKQKSMANMFYTQQMMWEDVYDGANHRRKLVSLNSNVVSMTGYQNFRSDVRKKVNAYYNLPSFAGSTHTLNLGKSLTLTDKNNTLQYYKVISNTANVTVSQSGNTLKITPNSNSKPSGQIELQYQIDSSYIGSTQLYKHPNYQDVMRLRVQDPRRFNIKLNVNLNANVTVEHRDAYNNNRLVTNEVYSRLIGSSYSFSPKSRISTGGNTYTPTSTQAKTGSVPQEGRTVIFYYNLLRDITVNHIDRRDNRLITRTVETKPRGASYSYSPRTNLKKGKYTYRPTSTSKQSGTVGGSNITVNFYYDTPLIETGLEKIQIYTAPASDGLPVIVNLKKNNHYPTSVKDMETSKVNVVLYKGSTKLETKTYTAKNLPTEVEFTVPSSSLSIDEVSEYTVKLENFDKNAFDIPSNQLQISTDGYTSEELTLEKELLESDVTNYEGVIKTERKIGQQMVKFHEYLNLAVEKTPDMKTGYGFYMPIELDYQNDLGNKTITTDFELLVPEAITDESYIPYNQSSGQSIVPLEMINDSLSPNRKETSQSYALQHVNVERKTGYLFTDQQVSNNDERLKYDVISGDRKFYLPIWSEVGTYDLFLQNTEPMGVNAINIEFTDELAIIAHMYAHYGSETLDQDEILIEPIDLDHPFPKGLPKGWTQNDLDWLQNAS